MKCGQDLTGWTDGQTDRLTNVQTVRCTTRTDDNHFNEGQTNGCGEEPQTRFLRLDKQAVEL